jgi:nitrite reductase/ring-hydroxylating ferredoxin subunit
MQELVRVAHQSSLQDSTPVCVQHKGVPYCVVRMQDEIRAFITICSHEEKAFTPEMIDRCLVCPFHRVYFDASSGEVRDRNGKSVPKGLATVSTETRDGYIYVVSEDAHYEFLAQSDTRRQERRARQPRSRRWFGFLRNVLIRRRP